MGNYADGPWWRSPAVIATVTAALTALVLVLHAGQPGRASAEADSVEAGNAAAAHAGATTLVTASESKVTLKRVRDDRESRAVSDALRSIDGGVVLMPPNRSPAEPTDPPKPAAAADATWAASPTPSARPTDATARHAPSTPTPASQPTPLPTATRQPTTTKPIAFGAYVHGAPWSSAPLQAFEQTLGRSLAIVMWYQTWGAGGASAFDHAMMDRAAAGGRMPMLTWVPNSAAPFRLTDVTSGHHDTYIRTFARSAAAWGRPFLLRPMHEMNGDWHVWSPGVNGNTAAHYVAAWRHLRRVFAEEGASNVLWVWSPNTYVPQTKITLPSVYPGDEHVDWVALDGYNNGSAQAWSSWTSFTAEFADSYDTVGALTSKPLMIAEVASCEQGGDKAEWIRSALIHEIPTRFPRIAALVWFNQDKECDWRLDSSPEVLASARAALAEALWDGRLP